MHIKTLPLVAGLCTLGLTAGFGPLAGAKGTPHEAAVKACAQARDGAPATPVTAIADGRGGSLVWLTDAETNLWLCSADADGQVYAYDMIFDDLLAGAGAGLVKPIVIDGDGAPIEPVQDPLLVAEQACQAYLDGEGGTVVSKGADGLNANWLPGYFVFIETEAGETYLCNATPNAQVWAFARIGEPLGDPFKPGNPVG
jgi:hypothetical protein